MIETKQDLYKQRPTSPHLSIYRKQISSVLSILHRMTGIGLFFGLLILVWWFVVLSFSKFDPIYFSLIKSCAAKVCLMLLSFAWFYHLGNGIRHLMWDSGYGFSIKSVNITGWSVIVFSSLMTIFLWI